MKYREECTAPNSTPLCKDCARSVQNPALNAPKRAPMIRGHECRDWIPYEKAFKKPENEMRLLHTLCNYIDVTLGPL